MRYGLAAVMLLIGIVVVDANAIVAAFCIAAAAALVVTHATA